jgi:hypothetical protein
LDKGEERGAELVVAGCVASDLLQLVERAFDEFAFAIDDHGHLNFFLRLVLLGMIWRGALSPDVCANPLSIIALVGNHDGAPFETNEQCLGAHEVMDLADPSAATVRSA